MKPGLVSIIIPIRHGEDVFRVVSSVQASTYRNIEIIIVDECKERSAQRNVGIKQAEGEFLLILDSDQPISPWLIGQCVSLAKQGYDALYIPELILGKGWFNTVRRFERQFYTGTAIDVVRFVRAHNCPYFDESMSGPEDSDWDRRIIGKRGVCGSYLYHDDKVNFQTYFKKKAYYAKSMRRYAQKHKGDKVLNPFWRCFWVFMENGKWRTFLSRPDLALCVLGIILIRGVIYLWRR